MKEVRANANTPLPLGRQGENLARRIVFDVSGWLSAYGAGTVRLLHQRPQDNAPYPVSITQEAGYVYWDVTAADTAQAGIHGQAELRYYVGETLVKSAIYKTSVSPALGMETEEAPQAGQNWIDNLLDAAEQAQEATRAAVNAAQSMEDALLAQVDVERLTNSELEHLLT